MSFANKVKQFIKDAPVASSGTNINYGPLTLVPMIITFHGQGSTPDKRTLAEYAEAKGVDVDDVELEKDDSFQLHMRIGVQEVNPGLSFEAVERDISVVNSSLKTKTDWQEIVLPSLEKVLGKDWYEKYIPAEGKKAPVVYVAAEMVDSLRTPKMVTDPETGKQVPGKNYGVPKLIAKYASLEECIAAHDERYPQRGGAVAAGDEGDEDEGDDEGEEGEIDEEVLNQVYKVYKSSKSNRKNTIALVARNKAWKEYDAETLVDAAIEANG